MISRFHVVWCVAVLLLVQGCSTTNHPPLVTQAYSDLTSHYNAYFNSKEKLKGVLQSVDKTHVDNYKEVIPLFTYSNPKECASYSADLEEVEKKSTTSVQIHKYSNYNDDHFLLMGKARYLKGDYDKAQDYFKYITTEYKDGVDYVRERKRQGKTAKPNYKKKPAKKPKFKQVLDENGNLALQKIDERPTYKLFIHEPARAEALLWLAKTYIATGKYAEAASVIQYARSDDKFYKNLDPQIELTDAENLLRQRNYREAITPLEKFLTTTKSKKKRIRPCFILAQIYELQGNYQQAAYYYKKVLKSNPNYDMEFYAKIKRANLGRKSGKGNDEVKKVLLAMSRDGKYKDYLDQIYYELGEISLNEHNRESARKYFKKSVATSTKNQEQLAMSYLAMAKMDYDDEAYTSSKLYYDSTLTALSKNDTGYAAIEKRSRVLDKLVAHLSSIHLEDSLQRLAKLPKNERERILKKIIEEQQKDKDRNEDQKNTSRNQNSNNNSNSGASAKTTTENNSSSGSEQTFYFYNPVLRSAGYNDFIKRWGRRKLEENWRRKDKSLTTLADDSDTKKDNNAATENSENSLDDDFEKLMAQLPMTPEKMKASEDKIVEAYYSAGCIYKDDLRNYKKATTTFEELNRKYGKHKLQLESYYQLYLLAGLTKNNSKAAQYKSYILAEYPNSKVAKFLEDPSYFDLEKKKENEIVDYYQSAYNDYSKGLYASAEQKIKMADVQFNPNTLKPKFDLLNVMILAKQNRLEDYVQALNKLITKLPPCAEKDIAQRMLSDLNQSKLPQIDLSKQIKPESLTAATDSTSKPPTAAYQASGNLDKEVTKPATNNAQENTKSTADNAKPEGTKNAVQDTVKQLPAKVDSAAEKKDTTVAKPYKPLSKAERLDSIMRAEKANKNKPPAVLKPQAGDSSNTKPATKTAGSDAVKTNPSTNTPQPTTRPIEKPRVDSLPPKLQAKVDSLAQRKAFVKDSLAKKALMDSAAKAQRLIQIKDSLTRKLKADSTAAAKRKAFVKDSLAKKALTDSAVKAQRLIQIKDSLTRKLKADSTAAAKRAAFIKDSLTKKVVVKPAAKDTTKAAVKVAIDTPQKISTPLPTFDTDTSSVIFGMSDNAPHSVIIFYRDPAAFNDALITKLDAANAHITTASPITARSVIVDNNFKLILLKPFADKVSAMAYLTELKNKPKIFDDLQAAQYELFAISQLNYSTLIANKKINNYARFHRVNYK